jgi:hypothetical protein
MRLNRQAVLTIAISFYFIKNINDDGRECQILYGTMPVPSIAIEQFLLYYKGPEIQPCFVCFPKGCIGHFQIEQGTGAIRLF